ncbi:Spc7-domain-containing protein [Xylariaceae sp. FL1272]|nr:Spc7-domain-containing protein [Xylariaceae sp. FL1272]
MAGNGNTTIPPTRRPRKSTGHSPVRKKMEKENITVDLASSMAGNASRKKSRSKSMGPGGLDVLRSGTGNRRVSLAAPLKPPPRSILKPTMPLLPEIPPHKSKRKSPPSGSVQGAEKLSNPFQNDDSSSSGTKIALRTEEDQQAAARAREEEERKQMEKEISDRREARRKSLANRRVSFAAEATLHTFHEVEYNQDSTTSTDSTRRASQAPTPAPAPLASDPPSTPPEQVEEPVPEYPEPQRDLHQRKRRRSSGVATMDDDHTLASTVYSSDSDVTEGVTEIHEDMGSDSGSESDTDGVTMEMDADEMTGTSVASAMTARSAFMEDDGNDSLDDILRMATERAETQNIDEAEEIIPSFGWIKKPAPKPASPVRQQQDPVEPASELDKNPEITEPVDMEMTKPMGGIIEANDDTDEELPEEEMSMDVTHALGGILPSRNSHADSPDAPLIQFESDPVDDATMELTKAIGGIRGSQQDVEDFADSDANEDMSMEFTSVMGGLLSTNKSNAAKRRMSVGRRHTLAGNDEATMDMTMGLGRIIQTNDEVEEEDDEATMGMDMTTAVGGIIRVSSPAKSSPAKDQVQAKHIMEQEADIPDGEGMPTSSPRRRLSDMAEPKSTHAPGNPGMLPFRGKGLRRSTDRRASETPKQQSPSRARTVSKSPSPKKAPTPSTPQDSSPVKTPVSQPSQRRSASPTRPASAHSTRSTRSNATPTSTAKTNPRLSIFQTHPSTGVTTPQVVLTPQRRLSGIGADRAGLGSPRVAAIFERRGSIGDSADIFVPRSGPRAVSFADPQLIEDEVEKERQSEHHKENSRSILEREADGEDENNTASLKDMISSMTPKKTKKNFLKGRKSLHVGSASGLLGKRPAELDDEDDDYDRDGVKRLKNHQSSPVKNVRLHAPPTKEETTGRLTRSTGKKLDFSNANSTTPSLNLSPTKERTTASSPQAKGRFKEVESDQPTNTFSFDEPVPLQKPERLIDDDAEHIHLQDFLNMTSIRFMELTTTKRRHTEAPTTSKGFLPDKEDLSLERCVVAGACTVPMLELYQHSCRELKKYISEGRRIVREIETETFEENPPLFKEYISATPEFKTLMDNQFKNVKTHARLLSKAMWYEWRMKLQDGLKEGLVKISEGMAEDDVLLSQQQELLDSVLPKMAEKFETLTVEGENLEAAARELEDCDPAELQAARAELSEVDKGIEEKKRMIEILRNQLRDTESGIEQATQQKQAYVNDIAAAEKVREECRGWSSKDVNALKARVDTLEKKHGWAIVGMDGPRMRLTYRREIELVLDVLALQSYSDNDTAAPPIDLHYVKTNRDGEREDASPEMAFFVSSIVDHVRDLVCARSRPKAKASEVLRVVGNAWDLAKHVEWEVRYLNCTFPTRVLSIDQAVVVKSSVFIGQLETKIEVLFKLQKIAVKGEGKARDMGIGIWTEARVVYGEQFKSENLVAFLSERIGAMVTKGEGERWGDVVAELMRKLVGRGKK